VRIGTPPDGAGLTQEGWRQKINNNNNSARRGGARDDDAAASAVACPYHTSRHAPNKPRVWVGVRANPVHRAWPHYCWLVTLGGTSSHCCRCRRC